MQLTITLTEQYFCRAIFVSLKDDEFNLFQFNSKMNIGFGQCFQAPHGLQHLRICSAKNVIPMSVCSLGIAKAFEVALGSTYVNILFYDHTIHMEWMRATSNVPSFT